MAAEVGIVIDYGKNYPEPPYIEPDGQLAEENPDQIHRGQVRLAYRLADRYAGRLLFVHNIGWHHWDGTRWAFDDVGATKRAVIDVLRQALADSLVDKDLRADVHRCESAAGIKGVLDIASALAQFASTARNLDVDPYLLNCANGTLDLGTLDVRPHDPADRITKICRGAYDNSAHESALWTAFLERVLPDEDVRGFLQRLIGVALLGAVREHVLPILNGKGANGKSAWDKAIRHALGDYACTAEPSLFMARDGAHPTGEMDLRGVRWASVSESEKGRALAEATMKRLTGGDTIRARRMRMDFIEFTPSHLACLITNHLPTVSGDDPAIWRRIRVVPWTVIIPDEEQDVELDDRLQVEADAVLAWAVAGWREYQNKGLAEPDAVLAATDEYQADNDAVGRFIKDSCVTGPAVKATIDRLYEAWQAWRARDGGPEMTSRAFGKALDAKGHPMAKRTAEGRWRTGIAVKANDPMGFDR
jgi:putative DNA primase/helicase